MHRYEFLKSVWRPYPMISHQMDVEICDLNNDQCDQIVRFEKWHFGRIVALTNKQISLLNGDQLRVFSCHQQFYFIEGKDFHIDQILCLGDLIGIKDQQVILLAPNEIQALPWQNGIQSNSISGFLMAPISERNEIDQIDQLATKWKNKAETLVKYQKLKNQLHQFFTAEGFVQIETPSLVDCPGTEPSLEVFQTKLKIGRHLFDKYLPTSPELHLKKALTYGFNKIYEIKNCFRNDEITERHEPEFTMIEWYRTYSDLKKIQKDVIQLIYFLSAKFQIQPPVNVLCFQVSELFKIYCDFELKPNTNEQELRALAERLNVDVHAADSIDDVFFLIFMDQIESQLPSNSLIFVSDYPPYQAALARLTQQGWGDRFEVYWKGLELANAFCELNDPQLQRTRSQQDLQKKIANLKQQIQLDEEFFESLEMGMPPASGIALGVERLAMAMFDINNIEDLKLFNYQPHKNRLRK